MKTLLILACLAGSLAGCNTYYEQDKERAKETLLLRKFSGVDSSNLSRGWVSICPDHWETVSCTKFKATSPWGEEVTGIVSCRTSGSCMVLVFAGDK